MLGLVDISADGIVDGMNDVDGSTEARRLGFNEGVLLGNNEAENVGTTEGLVDADGTLLGPLDGLADRSTEGIRLGSKEVVILGSDDD